MGLYNSFGGGRFSFWQSWLTRAIRFANSQASASNAGVPTAPYLPESNCTYLAHIWSVKELYSLWASCTVIKDWFWHDWSSNFNVISMSKTSKIHMSTTILLCLLCPLVWPFCSKEYFPINTTIPLHPPCTASTPSSYLCLFLTQPDIYDSDLPKLSCILHMENFNTTGCTW